MPTFWVFFWSGFIGLPLMVLLAYGLRPRDGGFEKDTSHIWVTPQKHAKIRDATVRDVWEHNHKGQKWQDHLDNLFYSWSVFLCIVFLVILFYFADLIFTSLGDTTSHGFFWKVGVPILGGLTALGFYWIQKSAFNMKIAFFKVLNIISLVVLAILLILLFIFTFLKRPFPISHNWMWYLMGSTVLFLILDAIFGKQQKTKAAKGGNKLEKWVDEVVYDQFAYNVPDNFSALMQAIAFMAKRGDYDAKLYNKEFFNRTEDLMLDLVKGRAMSIKDEKVYRAQDEVLKTLQTLYFHACDNLRGYEVHPQIKAALNKKRNV